jgi:hypothetical protein
MKSTWKDVKNQGKVKNLYLLVFTVCRPEPMQISTLAMSERWGNIQNTYLHRSRPAVRWL